MSQITVDSPHNNFTFTQDGHEQVAHSTWFRGEHCNFNPAIANIRGCDSADLYVLDGWLPEQPMIDANTRITAFGSCFAQHIGAWLADRNFNVLTDKSVAEDNSYVVHFGEGMVNSFVMLQQFEWAFEAKTFNEELWHGYKAESYGYDEKIRQATRKLFEQTDVFILTLGLSEIWYDEITGGVFWRAVPAEKYDPSRHKFRTSSVEENKANLHRIYQLVRKYRPDAKIIFTLSPIPLVATFRPISCITANAVSKSVLRAALDEFLRELEDSKHAFYWPSYEIVMDLFTNRWQSDRRHLVTPILDFVMTLFERHWCKDISPKYTLAQAWIRARAATQTLPADLDQKISAGDVAYIDRSYKYFSSLGNNEDAQLIATRAGEVAKSFPQIQEWLANIK